MISDVAGVLIAGGKSRRMGRDKRFLAVSGRSLFDRTLDVLESVFKEIIVVLAEPVPELDVRGFQVVYDAIPNCGSLGGLYTGLRSTPLPRVFAVACDMPFLNPSLVRYFSKFDSSADIVVAELATGVHPMHAVYSQKCRPLLEAMAQRGDLKIQRLFLEPDLLVRVVREAELAPLDPGLRSFQNINTPQDLALAESLLPPVS
ncbi:MAG: molybdenum cofactor guanylyltransferase [Nitrospiraceae bacterium]